MRKTANGAEITENVGNDAEISKEICGVPVILAGTFQAAQKFTRKARKYNATDNL